MSSKLVQMERLEEVGSAIESYPQMRGWNEIEVSGGLHPWCLDDTPDQIRKANDRHHILMGIFQHPSFVEAKHNGYQAICEDVMDGLGDVERIMATCHEGKSFMQYVTQSFRSDRHRQNCFFLVRGNCAAILSEILSTSTHIQLIDLNRNCHTSNINDHRVRRLSLGVIEGVSRAIAVTGSVLHVATVFDCREAMSILLHTWRSARLGIDPVDTNTETPLFLAAKLGRIEILQMLLLAKADVNESAGSRYLIKGIKLHEDTNTITPLSIACSRLFKPTVKVLLEALADPNAANSCSWRGSAMMACLEQRQVVEDTSVKEIVELLLQQKADVNGKPDNERSPDFRNSVLVTARERWPDTMRMLLNNRACVNTQDSFGDGPLTRGSLLNLNAVDILVRLGTESYGIE
jgi:hypothetical protein